MFVARRVTKRGIGCAQVAANHTIPITEPRVDVSRHVQRMRIVGCDHVVLVSDLKQLALAPRDIVRVHEVMHRAGMIRILLVNTQKNFGGLIRVRAGDSIGRRRGKMRERVEDGGLGIIGVCLVDFFHGLFPATYAQPVIVGRGIQEESFSSSKKKLLALGRWRKGLGLFDCLPSLLAELRAGTRWPQRLKQSHREAPLCHRAFRIGRGDMLELLARLGICHVMEQRDGLIEFFLRLRSAGDGKIDCGHFVRGTVVLAVGGHSLEKYHKAEQDTVISRSTHITAYFSRDILTSERDLEKIWSIQLA